jgi:hypothetical protein
MGTDLPQQKSTKGGGGLIFKKHNNLKKIANDGRSTACEWWKVSSFDETKSVFHA